MLAIVRFKTGVLAKRLGENVSRQGSAQEVAITAKAAIEDGNLATLTTIAQLMPARHAKGAVNICAGVGSSFSGGRSCGGRRRKARWPGRQFAGDFDGSCQPQRHQNVVQSSPISRAGHIVLLREVDREVYRRGASMQARNCKRPDVPDRRRETVIRKGLKDEWQSVAVVAIPSRIRGPGADYVTFQFDKGVAWYGYRDYRLPRRVRQ